jgi:ubiquinone/menaquinone biosynthesis C-methylase UbiE
MSGARGGGDNPPHYSYTHYASAAVAEGFDALRFSGPIGEMLAEAQEQVLDRFLAPLRARALLDVGTGTGRAAIALARRGARVTAVDTSAEMLAVARRRAGEAAVNVAFDRGDAHALPFANRSFDSAVALRVLMHAPGWERCLGELCRVSRSRVVFDYPSAISVAAVQVAARWLAVALGRQAEAYRVFLPSRVRRVLAHEGYRVIAVHRQFVLPIGFHKAVGSRRFTEGVEAALRVARLDRLFGSPITIVAERCAS